MIIDSFNPHNRSSCFTRHAISASCYPGCECRCHVTLTPLFVVLSKLIGLGYIEMHHELNRHASYYYRKAKEEVVDRD